MEKLLTFHGKSERGVFNYVIDTHHQFLEKTAAEYHPEISNYIHNAKPIPGAVQVLLTALGAGEYWGANANGDYFTTDSLAHSGKDYGHQTFLNAHPYMHHVNKDPAKSYGKVVLSVYNPTYHRVELIIVINKARAPDLAARIDSGEMVDWSMGCRVPFDVCSICGNKAPSRKQYCEHAKFYLNKIWPPTGQQVHVINTRPRFHDISYVLIGADRIAKTLMKVAHVEQSEAISSAFAAEKLGLNQKVSAVKKEAVIDKQVPADPANPPASMDDVKRILDPITEIKARDPMLPTAKLDYLAEQPLNKSMATLCAMGILPHPAEFQRIILIKLGHEKLAKQLWDKNICFDPDSDIEGESDLIKLSFDNFDPRIFEVMKEHLPERSAYNHYVLPRMMKYAYDGTEPKYANMVDLSAAERERLADRRKPFSPVALMAAALIGYKSLTKSAPKEMLTGIDKLVDKNPGLAIAVGLGAIGLSKSIFGAKSKGHEAPSMSMDQRDFMDRLREAQDRPYVKIAGLQPGGAVKRLGTIVPIWMGSDVLQKRKEANPYKHESTIGKMIRKYPDLVSSALVVDAMLTLKGGGSGKKIRQAKTLMKNLAPNIAKIKSKVRSPFGSMGFAKAAAESGDLETLLKIAFTNNPFGDALAETFVFGRKNYPARLVGSLIDQGIIAGAGKLSERKQKKQKQNKLY